MYKYIIIFGMNIFEGNRYSAELEILELVQLEISEAQLVAVHTYLKSKLQGRIQDFWKESSYV